MGESANDVLGERLHIVCTESFVCGVLKVVVEQVYLRGEAPECRVVWELGMANFGIEILRPFCRCVLIEELCTKDWPLNGNGTCLSARCSNECRFLVVFGKSERARDKKT